MDQNDAAILARFKYDPETGVVLDLIKDKPAFVINHNRGYKMGRFNGRNYLAHRVAWFLSHSHWPKEIDHINGKKADNRLCNLRDVTRRENTRNLPRRGDGPVGVAWLSNLQKWRARIKVCGQEKHLGVFETRAEAVMARRAAEREFGFHTNHGRIAA